MTPELISSSTRRAVLGMGHTGRSVARFWKEQGLPFIAMDTRPDLSSSPVMKEELDGIETHFGEIDPRLMSQIDLMIASPGIAMDSPAITLAILICLWPRQRVPLSALPDQMVSRV